MTPITIICGATGSGKSALALSLAEKHQGVIINADSQQMYRELRILTARPTEEEEAQAPHRLYGTLPAHIACSAGKWLEFAKMEIDWALSEKKHPIVVGGTGLYIKALMEGIAEVPEIAPPIRAQAMSDYEAMGKEAFAERLKAVDPEFFTRLAVHDKQRLIRAYEVWLGTGKSLSWWQKQGATPPYPRESFTIHKVELPREELYRRCDARFLKMIEEGALEEVKNLTSPERGEVAEHSEAGGGDSSSTPSRPSATLPPLGGGNLSKIIGVRELSSYICGEISLDQATGAAQQATRNYAKRQLTWFRNQLKMK